MKLSRSAEADVVESLRRYPDDHLVFRPEMYLRADGFLPVYRDGLSEFLHRRLYRLTVQPDLGRRKLVRICDRHGCVNPLHHRTAEGLEPGSRERCPNGHLYEGNTTWSGHCAICARARQARRAGHAGPDAAAINAAKDVCPNGHEYDEANTYYWQTARGTHRKCRACNRARAAARRRRPVLEQAA